MPPTSHWKNVERAACVFIGSTRNPLSGINSGHKTHSDSLHPKIFLEVKLRRKHACNELYFKTLPLARNERKTLVIALKQHRQSDPPWLMLIDPRDIHTIADLIERKGNEPCQKISRKKPTKKMPSQSTCGIEVPFE